jgi:hypothetical protein
VLSSLSSLSNNTPYRVPYSLSTSFDRSLCRHRDKVVFIMVFVDFGGCRERCCFSAHAIRRAHEKPMPRHHCTNQSINHCLPTDGANTHMATILSTKGVATTSTPWMYIYENDTIAPNPSWIANGQHTHTHMATPSTYTSNDNYTMDIRTHTRTLP